MLTWVVRAQVQNAARSVSRLLLLLGGASALQDESAHVTCGVDLAQVLDGVGAREPPGTLLARAVSQHLAAADARRRSGASASVPLLAAAPATRRRHSPDEVYIVPVERSVARTGAGVVGDTDMRRVCVSVALRARLDALLGAMEARKHVPLVLSTGAPHASWALPIGCCVHAGGAVVASHLSASVTRDVHATLLALGLLPAPPPPAPAPHAVRARADMDAAARPARAELCGEEPWRHGSSGGMAGPVYCVAPLRGLAALLAAPGDAPGGGVFALAAVAHGTVVLSSLIKAPHVC